MFRTSSIGAKVSSVKAQGLYLRGGVAEGAYSAFPETPGWIWEEGKE